MIRRCLRIGGMVEIPVGIFFRELRVLGLRSWCFGFRGWRSGAIIHSRRHSNSGANAGIVLASTHQIPESEHNSKNNDQKQKQSDQMPAFQNKIAAALFFF